MVNHLTADLLIRTVRCIIVLRGDFLLTLDYKEIGKRIVKRRKELGLKQWQVEEKAEISFGYLSNIERASSILSVEMLMRICYALDTTPNEFLLGAVAEMEDNDYQRSITSRVKQMSSKQARMALSMMDWILSQKLE